MNTLGYIRISKDEPGSLSLDYQRDSIKKYALANDLALVDIIADNGISAKDIAHRPGVKRVLHAVDTNAIDAIIVYKSDRLARDDIESLQIDKLFRERGVQYHSVTEGPLINNSVDDRFMACIRAGLNQRERHVISVRTNQALQLKRERGERLGGRVRYGLAVDNKTLVVSASEQAIVADIRALAGQGFSTRAIVRVLDQKGYTTRKGSRFTQTQVCRILRVA